MRGDKMDITELLADESFINYCKGSSPVDVAFWENYTRENPGQQEVVALAKERFLVLFNVLAEADREQQVMRLKNKMNQKERAAVIKMDSWLEESPKKIFPLLLKISGAAAVLLLIGLFAYYYFSPAKNNSIKTFTTSYGERKNIQLPDGSVVNLNAGSKIEITESFGVSARNVYLEGEAFFDVKHNAKLPFIVHTPAMDIKALGTAFDVKAYLNEKITETSLIRGLVEVTLKEDANKILLLHPNQKIAWEHPNQKTNSNNATAEQQETPNMRDGILKKLVVTNHGDIKEIAWKENKLIFEDDSFNDIATLLERWYGAHIIFQDEAIRSYRFTGIFEKEDLQTVLDFLKESRHFNFKIDTGETVKVFLSK